MPTKPSLHLLLAILALLILGTHGAMAATSTTPDCSGPATTGGTNFQSQVQTALTAQANNQASAASKVMANIQNLDPQLYVCLDNITTMFDTISGSNPLSLVANTMWDAVKGMLNQTCTMALSTINQIKASALSQANLLCTPLPGLGLGLSGISLPTQACNGVNLLSPQLTTSTNGSSPPSGYNRVQIWGQ